MRRTTRHLELTQAGHVLYRHSLKMLSEVRTATAVIDRLGERVRGDIRIRVPTGFGHLYMSTFLLEFGRSYPDVAMRVLINDHIDDLVSAEVDVALKITSSPPEDHVARRVCDIQWCLCAAPGLFDEGAGPNSVNDILNYDLLTPASLGRHFPLRFKHGDDTLSINVSPRLQSGDYPFLIQAVLSGQGIALLPRYAVWSYLQSGELHEILPDFTPDGAGDGLYILTASDRFPARATQVLIQRTMEYVRSVQYQWNG